MFWLIDETINKIKKKLKIASPSALWHKAGVKIGYSFVCKVMQSEIDKINWQTYKITLSPPFVDNEIDNQLMQIEWFKRDLDEGYYLV